MFVCVRLSFQAASCATARGAAFFMRLSYDHIATIKRPGDSTGLATDDFGQPTTAPDDIIVYDADAIDWQDFSSKEMMSQMYRSSTGDQLLRDAMTGYFPPGKFPASVQEGDFVESTIRGNAKEGHVLSVDSLEESIVVRWQK